MKAKLAYITSPAPNRFILHVQPEDCEGILTFEISKAHLANIIIDGASMSLREYPTAFNVASPENANGRTASGA